MEACKTDNAFSGIAAFETRHQRLVRAALATGLAGALILGGVPALAFAADDAQDACAARSQIELLADGSATGERMLVFNQGLIDQVGKQHTGGACLCYAAAYCATITSGSVHSWSEYSVDGYSAYAGNMTDEFDCTNYYDQQSTLRACYDAINEGKPAILYGNTNWGQHWVAIVGYQGVTDPNNLSMDNFLMLDPSTAMPDEPVALSSNIVSLRYGDTFGNVRVSKSSVGVDDGRERTERFSDCYLDDWFVLNGALDFVCDRGYLSGYGNGTFGPSDTLTRGQAAVILWRIAGMPAGNGAAEFSDVASSAYYAEAVSWARDKGVANGVGANRFAPDDSVTREQLAKMLANYARSVKGASVSSDCEALSQRADSESVSPWARSDMGWCVDVGIMGGSWENGQQYLHPQSNAKRSETASMIMNFCNKVL